MTTGNAIAIIGAIAGVITGVTALVVALTNLVAQLRHATDPNAHVGQAAAPAPAAAAELEQSSHGQQM